MSQREENGELNHRVRINPLAKRRRIKDAVVRGSASCERGLWACGEAFPEPAGVSCERSVSMVFNAN